MFDSLPAPGVLADADDATVVAAIEEAARLEAAAAARRLQAIAELMARRCHDGQDGRALWACDRWDAAAAEVAAALGISHRQASGQMHQAQALRERLPKVAALFGDGRISARLVSTITWRTRLVTDGAAMAGVDAAIAGRAAAWGALSESKLEQAIDLWVTRYDPAALRQIREGARGRDVGFGKPDDATGTVSLWGRLLASDGTTLERRLRDMTAAVRGDDPRTAGQLRSDALGALGAGADRLACACGNPACAAAAGRQSSSAHVVINIVAAPDALHAAPDPRISGDGPRDPIGPQPPQPPAQPVQPTEPPPAQPQPQPVQPTAVLLGGGVVPAPLLAQLIATGATIRPLTAPAPVCETGYRPSAGLDRFVRMRDMTCRFPGCNQPADGCDIDHAVAWPAGPTHPSNLRCLCRKHHHLKTFWVGDPGWSDVQYADGTILWTAPTGHTYTTRPGCALFFPELDTHTGELPPMAADTPTADRGVHMPKRRRTRAADHAAAIKAERALNNTTQHTNQPHHTHKHRLAPEDDEPPPF